MSLGISDSSAGVQRLAVSNAGAVELGSATPTSYLSVNGKQLLNGSYLADGTISSAGLNRITGAVSLQSWAETEVHVGVALAGFGTINGGFINDWSTNSFTASYPEPNANQTATLSYSVF